MPGPLPKPAELQKLAGNPGKRKIKSTPKPKAFALPPPRGLLPRARLLWKQIADDLEKLGLLTVIDGATFSLLVTHYAIAWEASQAIKKDGVLITWKKLNYLPNLRAIVIFLWKVMRIRIFGVNQKCLLRTLKE